MPAPICGLPLCGAGCLPLRRIVNRFGATRFSPAELLKRTLDRTEYENHSRFGTGSSHFQLAPSTVRGSGTWVFRLLRSRARCLSSYPSLRELLDCLLAFLYILGVGE